VFIFQNTKESHVLSRRLLVEAENAGCAMSRRSLLFAAALALQQGDAVCALNIAQSQSRVDNATFKNIKVSVLV
jgi:hypothetical protein